MPKVKKKKPDKKRKPIKPKGSKQRDWLKIKAEFLKGKYATLEAFSKATKIPLSSVQRASTKHKWMKDKGKLIAKTIEKVAFINAGSVVEANKRHLTIGLRLQKKGLKILATAKLQAPEALRAVNMGVQMERQALGMDTASPGEAGKVEDNRVQTIVQVYNDSNKAKRSQFVKSCRQLFGTPDAPSSGGDGSGVE